MIWHGQYSRPASINTDWYPLSFSSSFRPFTNHAHSSHGSTNHGQTSPGLTNHAHSSAGSTNQRASSWVASINEGFRCSWITTSPRLLST
ncbi:hypothetical protein E2C01_046678 [Portunus trituberculatus]|uniref:Uncharacterized protein n=1 Tax=Portunus trituberculatus TaxID=210409 RepID=A0A5B7FYG5_PORTR|nr:hypothetical protein [Portunus trituberculatus]